MAQAGRPASRHGTYDAFRTDFNPETATDELPSQSVFSYDDTEDVRQPRENPTVHRRRSSSTKSMSHGVIPTGPVVAVHMFDVPSDRSDSGESSPTQGTGLRRWSREALDGSEGCPPAFPQPPTTPRSSRPGSMRQRSSSGQRPSSSKKSRPPSSQKSSRDHSLEQEELLPPMATLRPQSSLGKYQVLPSISPTSDKLFVDSVSTNRSDGSEDQRGTEEMEYLTSRMAHQALVESSRRTSRESAQERACSLDGKEQKYESEHSKSNPPRRVSEPLPAAMTVPVEMRPSNHRDSSASSTTSPEPANERSHTSISQYKMDEAPKPSVEGQVLLGIKIPTNGTRHKQYFNQRDQLRCIVLFAEEVSGEDFSNHVLVLATPRQCFQNLSQTIEDAGLQTKSVLHLEELD